MIPGNGWEALYAPIKDGVPDETGHTTRLPVIAWDHGRDGVVTALVLGPVGDGMQTSTLVEAEYITPYGPGAVGEQKPEEFARYVRVA